MTAIVLHRALYANDEDGRSTIPVVIVGPFTAQPRFLASAESPYVTDVWCQGGGGHPIHVRETVEEIANLVDARQIHREPAPSSSTST